MIYHLVVGDEAGKPLQQAIDACPEMEGEILVLRDLLHLGPIQRLEGQSFSSLRSEWWQMLQPEFKSAIEVNDLEALLKIGNELNKSNTAEIWFWMAPWPADHCAYYWTLAYTKKFIGRISLVNVAHLPFLDESGKIFYPKNISEILPKELIKARKLARRVSPSEMELTLDAYESLVAANATIRVLEGEKKLTNQKADFYDPILISLLSGNFQKAAKIISLALAKSGIPTGDTFLAWRLQMLAENGSIESRGLAAKPYKDWEIRLGGMDDAATINPQNIPLTDAV